MIGAVIGEGFSLPRTARGPTMWPRVGLVWYSLGGAEQHSPPEPSWSRWSRSTPVMPEAIAAATPWGDARVVIMLRELNRTPVGPPRSGWTSAATVAGAHSDKVSKDSRYQETLRLGYRHATRTSVRFISLYTTGAHDWPSGWAWVLRAAKCERGLERGGRRITALPPRFLLGVPASLSSCRSAGDRAAAPSPRGELLLKQRCTRCRSGHDRVNSNTR